MAPPSRSARRTALDEFGRRHHNNAPSTPRLEIALIQNGETMPRPAIAAPPRAGPIAREAFTPTLLAATAEVKSSLGTSSGRTDCQAGRVNAPTAPMRNVNSNKLSGVAKSRPTIAAYTTHSAVYRTSTVIRNLRLSKISASAPAGIANRNTGSVLAVCTNATTKGSGLRIVISQPDAALYIQPPTLETRVAVQITAKAGWRNAAANDADCLDEAAR